MSGDFSFFAIVDGEDCIVSVSHERYTETKAIFPTRKLAETALNLQGDNSGLRIEEVEVIEK